MHRVAYKSAQADTLEGVDGMECSHILCIGTHAT